MKKHITYIALLVLTITSGYSQEIKSLKVDNNQLTLSLNETANFKYLTYLHSKFYKGTKDNYSGQWIRGKENNLGAFSFHKRPILDTENIQSTWNGYKLVDSTLNGISFKVVFPKKANKKRNWVWRARFWGHEPQTDLALLEKGFHLAYIDVSGLFGNEKAIKIWDGFYEFIIYKYHLNTKVVLEGMSRGGLIVFNWGNRNADKIACIYADAPVCDFKEWPAGIGKGKRSQENWEACLKAYGFSEDVALLYNGNPVNHMERIASCKVPILCVVGDVDEVVPVSENTLLLQKRLISLGWDLDIIHKPEVGHHPHSLKEPKPIVDFILNHTN